MGNVQGMEESEFAEMFSRFGEIQEPYIHKEKGFGFVKMVSIYTLAVDYITQILPLCIKTF